MESRESFSELSLENKTEFLSSTIDKCEYALFSNENLVKTAVLPLNSNEANMIQLNLMEEMKNITAQFMRDIVDKEELKDLLNKKGASFKITGFNSTCQSLNHQYIPFLHNLSLVQGKIIKTSNLEEQNSCLKSAFESLESFLKPTLLLFETDIKDLQVVINTEINGMKKTKIENLQNEGNKIDKTIRKYLVKLYEIVLKLEPKGFAQEVEFKKVEILSLIDDSYQKIGTFLGIPINEQTNIANLKGKPNTFAGLNSENYDNLTFSPIISSKNESNILYDTGKESEIDDLLKEFKQQDHNILNDTSILIHNFTTEAPEANLNVIESASSNIWLVIGLPIVGLMLVIGFIAAFLSKKYIKRSKKTSKENADVELDEIVPINEP